jgi:hypothetical protein
MIVVHHLNNSRSQRILWLQELELVAVEKKPVFKPTNCFGEEFSVAPRLEQHVALLRF